MPWHTKESTECVQEAQQHDVPMQAGSLLQSPLRFVDNQFGNVCFHKGQNVDENGRDTGCEYQPLLFDIHRNQPATTCWIAGRQTLGHAQFLGIYRWHQEVQGHEDRNCNWYTEIAERTSGIATQEMRVPEDAQEICDGKGAQSQHRAKQRGIRLVL